MEKKISMIAAVSEALSFRKMNPNANHEDVLGHISNFVSDKREEETKLSMIAAAAKALAIIEKEPSLNEKEIINRVMQQIPEITKTIDEHNKP